VSVTDARLRRLESRVKARPAPRHDLEVDLAAVEDGTADLAQYGRADAADICFLRDYLIFGASCVVPLLQAGACPIPLWVVAYPPDCRLPADTEHTLRVYWHAATEVMEGNPWWAYYFTHAHRKDLWPGIRRGYAQVTAAFGGEHDAVTLRKRIFTPDGGLWRLSSEVDSAQQRLMEAGCDLDVLRAEFVKREGCSHRKCAPGWSDRVKSVHQ
jgi:hypothetical protein